MSKSYTYIVSGKSGRRRLSIDEKSAPRVILQNLRDRREFSIGEQETVGGGFGFFFVLADFKSVTWTNSMGETRVRDFPPAHVTHEAWKTPEIMAEVEAIRAEWRELRQKK